MAELLINVVNDLRSSANEDGDILHAASNLDISNVHAQNICHVKHQGFNSDGLREAGSLPQKYLEEVMQFKFERVSETEVQRTNLWTGDVDVVSSTPNVNGEAMDVPLFIARRKKNDRHAIFGTEGSEYWFGGRTKVDKQKCDAIWGNIEAMTPQKKADHTKWSLGKMEYKTCIALTTTDFPQSYKGFLTAPLEYSQGKNVKKKAAYVPWNELDDIANVVKDNIGDHTKSVDIRDFSTYVLEDIVKVKGL